MRTLVAIGAHHDDLELRCGGTLAKYVKQGWHVVYVVATTTPYYHPWPEEQASGKFRSNKEVIDLRKQESREAAAILGLTDIHFFDFKSLYWYADGTTDRRYLDGHETTTDDFRYVNETLPGREFIVTASHCPAALDFLCDFLNEKDAGIVLTHFPDDAHWEHYATALLVCTAVRRLAADRQIRLYGWEQGTAGNLTMSFAPTHFVDITKTIDVKCNSLMSFVSQFQDHNPETSAKLARKKAREYGALIGMEYAEPFMAFQVPAFSYKDVRVPPAYDAGTANREL